MIGRKKPYSEAGIRRLCCARCKKRPAIHQWNCCALNNRYVAICLPCDIALNALVLRWMKVPGRKALMAAYRRRATR